ncbi:hypothetical protein RSPO_m01131 (plasmid) [Ralstonia solanacearum Po82]|uniref:Uncharacterized protein n=1 Tax=Ralstonia solanacearum (strain Po82) TaxID=1031711 RepID=F6GAH9_RALS8|nr:hypothetical protein RSPO_m01131 [Ralstonia solanacearum Po82]
MSAPIAIEAVLVFFVRKRAAAACRVWPVSGVYAGLPVAAGGLMGRVCVALRGIALSGIRINVPGLRLAERRTRP